MASACYRPGGCADIIEAVAERIDARHSIPRSRGLSAVRPARDLAVLRPERPRLSATAIASMIASLATMYTVKFIIFVIEKHCIISNIIVVMK